MSPRENWRGLSTSRASTMRPAHVPKIGLPAACKDPVSGTHAHSSMSLRSVVDSPPGMMSPPTASSSSGLRTRTAATATGGLASPVERSRLALRQRASALACSAKSPWRARTPIRTLPAPGLEQVLLGELRRLDPDHRLAELLAHAREHVRVLVVGRRLDDRPGAPGRVARLEDAGADEDGLGAELHHERGARWGRDPTRPEVGYRAPPGPRPAPDQLIGRAEVLGLGHQLLGRERREASACRGGPALVPHGLHAVARAPLALGADHRRALASRPELLAQVACAADK